jgi:preprotein translocase subunit SecA
VKNVRYQHADYDEALAAEAAATATAVEERPSRLAMASAAPFVRAGGKVGRNDPCPCGSGKKFKHCHGRLA